MSQTSRSEVCVGHRAKLSMSRPRSSVPDSGNAYDHLDIAFFSRLWADGAEIDIEHSVWCGQPYHQRQHPSRRDMDRRTAHRPTSRAGTGRSICLMCLRQPHGRREAAGRGERLGPSPPEKSSGLSDIRSVAGGAGTYIGRVRNSGYARFNKHQG